MSIKLRNRKMMFLAISLIVVSCLLILRSIEVHQSKSITQVSEQTNRALFQLIALHEQLERAEWDNEEYRKEILQSLESYTYESNKAYDIANNNKREIPGGLFETVFKLKKVAEHLWNANEPLLRELERQDIKTREQTIQSISEMIIAANFKFFITDSSADSWYLLNKELTGFIAKNMESTPKQFD